MSKKFVGALNPDAARLRTFQERVKILGSKAPLEGFVRDLVQEITERRRLGDGKIAQPQADKRQHLFLLLRASAPIRFRRLGIERDGNSSRCHRNLLYALL